MSPPLSSKPKAVVPLFPMQASFSIEYAPIFLFARLRVFNLSAPPLRRFSLFLGFPPPTARISHSTPASPFFLFKSLDLFFCRRSPYFPYAKEFPLRAVERSPGGYQL